MEPQRFRDPGTCILSQLSVGGEDDASFKQHRDRRWQWARPQVEGQGPSARGGHSATLVGPMDPHKGSARIFVFGGHFKDDGDSFEYLNDTHILDIDENTWMQPRVRGTVPEPRFGHSAALVGTRIVYFGGRGKTQHLRDLHALDASTLTWFQGPSSGGAPSARQGHTASLLGKKLYVFGGTSGTKYFGDLYCLDLESMAWLTPQTSGPKPTPRYGHAALLIGESLIIHGGFCLDSAELGSKDNAGDLLKNCYLSDIRVLDLPRMQYSRLRTHGRPPSGRFGHTLTLSEDDVICFGGWSGSQKDPPAGVMFSLRDKVKADTQSNEVQGKNEDETCDYCMTLRTYDMNWDQNKYLGIPPSSRYGHTATAIGPHLIIIGGWDGGKPLKDVTVLRDRTVNETAASTGDSPMGEAEMGYGQENAQNWDFEDSTYDLETNEN